MGHGRQPAGAFDLSMGSRFCQTLVNAGRIMHYAFSLRLPNIDVSGVWMLGLYAQVSGIRYVALWALSRPYPNNSESRYQHIYAQWENAECKSLSFHHAHLGYSNKSMILNWDTCDAPLLWEVKDYTAFVIRKRKWLVMELPGERMCLESKLCLW